MSRSDSRQVEDSNTDIDRRVRSFFSERDAGADVPSFSRLKPRDSASTGNFSFQWALPSTVSLLVLVGGLNWWFNTSQISEPQAYVPSTEQLMKEIEHSSLWRSPSDHLLTQTNQLQVWGVPELGSPLLPDSLEGHL